MPGNFNQNITPAQTAWTQQLEIWITPWGFLKGAAANNATARRAGGRTVVSWSPAVKSPSGQAYVVTGYINGDNLVEKVETRVEHPVMGDLLVEAEYSDYRDFGGVRVPGRIVQKRAGLQTFEATITNATPNPANLKELLTPPAPPAQAAGGEARGLAVIAAAKQAIPNKPIRYVVNTHAHFDHASGLAPFVAEGATILTHENNEEFLEDALAAPRRLVGDTLSKAGRKPDVEGVGDRVVLRGPAYTIELHHVRDLQHTDGMLIAYLPNEKVLFTADFGIPNPGAPPAPVNPSLTALVANVDRLKLDFNSYIAVHAPVPERPLTRADLMGAVGRGTN
jgi:glyoxylase-like metal-dependent hydrolase (beta-lactamase superfamily II)